MNTQNTPPDLGGGALYRGDRGNARVVHQTVQTTEAFLDLIHDLCPGGLLADVLRDEVCADCVGMRLSRLRVDIGHDDLGTLARAHGGISEAKSGGCAGHNDDFISDSVHFYIRCDAFLKGAA